MRSNIVIELTEEEIEELKKGTEITQTIPTYAKEDDKKGGLFRKLSIFIICRKIEV